jgi:branched-chain amino acid transport system ATP-binding protein
MTRSNGALALELDGVTKAFGGLVAVSDVTLSVRERERQAVIGPNGAGKTTLFNLITGQIPLTSGRISLFGQDVTGLPVHKRVARGMARTFQITNLFPTLRVWENVMLAAQGLVPTKFSMLKPVSRKSDLAERVDDALEAVGLADKASVRARELSHGEQRQLEIALALVSQPKLLLLDEPAAGLSAGERRTMARLIDNLPPDLTLILIEHDMDLALRLVSWVTVLQDGQVIVADQPDAIRNNEQVQEVYLGAG